MPCGMMRSHIVIARSATLSADSLGQQTVSVPTTVATLVGHVESSRRADDRESMGLMGEGSIVVTIPWHPDVRLGDRLSVYDTGYLTSPVEYGITSIEDDRQAHRWMRLACVRDLEQVGTQA